MKQVLFVCVHNAGRSHMASAFLNTAGSADLRAASAGTLPTERINPLVAEAMMETGIDISDNTPKALSQEMADNADLIINMGYAIDRRAPPPSCPRRTGVDDPAGQPLDTVRRIRAQVKVKVTELLEQEN